MTCCACINQSYKVKSGRTYGAPTFSPFYLYILQILDLHYTDIDIVDILGSEHDLPQLEHLTFCSMQSQTRGRQPVPPPVFRSRLRTLTMHQIRGPLPVNMGWMVNLVNFLIHCSELPALPDSLGELRSLEVLTVHGCGLAALPASVARLSRLRRLEVLDNKLESCPPLGALRQLRVLGLGGNNLTSLLEGILDLPLLEELNFRGNRIEQCPPLGSLRRLRILGMMDNYLTSLPEGILDLPLLTSVYIRNNCMYTLEWDVVKRLPLLGDDPMPDTFNPSDMRRFGALVMRSPNGAGGYRYPTIV